MKTICKCGRTYFCAPAISRVDGSHVCPVCGMAEAITIFTEEEQKVILMETEEIERKMGRIA